MAPTDFTLHGVSEIVCVFSLGDDYGNKGRSEN